MKNKIILSAELSSLSGFKNNIRSKSLEITLQNLEIDFKKVIGSYKGHKENSFIIDSKHQDIAVMIMKLFNQESILVIGQTGGAFLRFQNNQVEFLNGTMKEVNGELPEAWTMVDSKIYAVAA